MPPQLSPKLKHKTADAWHSALRRYLRPGEVVRAFAKTNSAKPLMNGIAVTNARVLGLFSGDIANTGPKVAIEADMISGIDFVGSGAHKDLIIATRFGGEINLGWVWEAEIDFVKFFMHQLAATGHREETRAVIPERSAYALHDPAEAASTESRGRSRSPVEYISSPLQAEQNAARRMREIGYADARITSSGADAGIDVVSSDAVAQVKWRGAQVSRPELQRLYGARGPGDHRLMLFIAASPYSSHAIEYADRVGMHLFTYDPLGQFTAVNALARKSLQPKPSPTATAPQPVSGTASATPDYRRKSLATNLEFWGSLFLALAVVLAGGVVAAIHNGGPIAEGVICALSAPASAYIGYRIWRRR